MIRPVIQLARPIFAVLLAGPLLSGCLVAAVPVAAGALIGKQAVDRKDARPPKPRKGARQATGPITTDGPRVTLLPLTELPRPSGGPAIPTGPAPAGMQYLYGSGEAAAASLQAYQALRNHVAAEARLRALKVAPDAVVLSRGATLPAPTFVPCGSKPLAVVLDIDETALLNLGYEANDAIRGTGYDDARWRQWEAGGAAAVVAVPGAVAAVTAARAAGVAVVFNSNRSAVNAQGTRAALRGAGLGDAVPGDTLWLRADGAPSGKDERRWAIAQRYCVIALVGDQLGDFSDLFNAPPLGEGVALRRATATDAKIASLWGAGWFVLPNPVYGTALRGGIDDVFPADRRWTPAP